MAPCGWEVSGCGCGKSCWTGYDPAVRERAAAAAALIMWAATGRRYGPCEVTVQPSPPRRAVPLYQTYELGPGGYALTTPVIDGGQWYNRPYANDDSIGCCTPAHCEVALPGPTTTANIVEVLVDAEVVDPGAYVVMDGYLLVRTDGSCWPVCANSGTHPTFSVTYRVGLDIPPAVQGAYERLACEMAKACTGGACALPQRMTRLTRQGVEIELEQVDTETPGALLTGIKDVDDIILMVNPHRLTAAPAVMSPDLPAPRRIT